MKSAFTHHLRGLEAFNRATHPDALREMQVVEETDPLTETFRERPSDWLAVPIAAVLGAVLTIVWSLS